MIKEETGQKREILECLGRKKQEKEVFGKIQVQENPHVFLGTEKATYML